MFSDFECPFCKRFAETTLPRIEERYVDSGKVLIAFKHLPLGIHPLAERAARVAHCADKQRQFWKVHDLFFQHLDEQTLEHVPEALHLGENELDACTASPATTEVIRRDAALAARLSVTGTPAFFVGRVLPGDLVKVTQTIVGAANLQAFETAINSVLKQGS
jgi:protein-disulfide isomerase